MREIIGRILREHAEFKKAILVLLGINLIMTVVSASGPMFIGHITDAAAAQKSWDDVLVYIVCYAVVSILSVLFAQARWNHETRHLDWQLHNQLNKRTLRHLVGLSIGQLRGEHSVVTSSKVSNGQSAVRQLFDGVVYQLLPTLLMAFIACVAMTIYYPVLGLVTMALCVVMVVWTGYIAKNTYRPLKKMKKFEHGVVHKRGGDAMRHLPSIMLAAHEERSLGMVAASRETAARNHRWIYIPMGKLMARMWMLNLGGRVAVMCIAAWYVFNGVYPVGALAAVMLWVMQSLGRLQDLQQLLRGMLQSWIDAELYFEVRDTKPDIDTPANSFTFDCIGGEVVFEEVLFNYGDSEKPALNHVSFRIGPVQKGGIVGPSGAGKSTLLSMLQGAYVPSLGSIRIDGVDVRTIDWVKYREQVGFIEQETVIFDWTLYENLMFGIPEHRREFLKKFPEKVHEALTKVGLEHLIPRLYKRMGETGRKLSGGEKQRVAIARIVLKEPDLLIVDEGTSSVDPKTERVVHQLLDSISPGSTRIFVAHRLSTVQDSDLILVMAEGKLIASGTHEELLQNCPLYAELVRDLMIRG